MKQPEPLTIKSITKGLNKTFYEFDERDYVVSIDNNGKQINCTCYHGSNIGVNKHDGCRHKQLVLKHLTEITNEK